MGRGYTFTCHTCRITYEVGYGSYGHFCLEPDNYTGETIGEYKRRLASLPESEQRMAIAKHFQMVMVIHSLHEWDSLDSEFSEIEEDYDERRKGYFYYSFNDAYRKRMDEAVTFARKALKERADLSPAELTRMANEAADFEIMDEEWAARIIESLKPKPPLPKDLQTKLKNWKARQRAAS